MDVSPDAKKTNPKAVAAVLIAGCMWGSIGLFVRALTDYGYGAMTIVFARMSIAVLVIFGFFAATRGLRHCRVRPRDLWCFVIGGLASAVMLNLFYSLSIIMNSLALASILLAAAPVFVLFLSAPLFHEPITAAKLQALVIVFGGCVLTSGIFGDGTAGPGSAGPSFSVLGLTVGLAGGLGWALYGIMTRVGINLGYSSLTITFYSFVFGTIFTAPFTDFGAITRSLGQAPAEVSLLLVAHSLFASVLPYMLFTYGMRFMETGTASILASIDPVCAAVWGFAIYHERPDWIMILGIVLVLAGVTVLNVPGGLKGLKGPKALEGPGRLVHGPTTIRRTDREQ
ncbi:MAG: DMT family transporter [Bifidobacteriaceae bacterium]|nr:DMT family transporter [Bifidobacteriaceae bacterium]